MKRTAKKLDRHVNEHNRLDIFKFRPKNESQAEAHRIFRGSDLTVLAGPAGSGKTFLATCFGIEEVLAGRAEKIVLTRPIVEAGESLGFLPGDVTAKTDPYMTPIMDSLTKIVGGNEGRRRQVEEAIEVRPLAYMRGATFDNAVCILDEAQNCTRSQLTLFVTRIGEGSKLIINGDPTQSDLPVCHQAFGEFCDRVEGVKGVALVEFDEADIVRHHLIGRLLRVL